MANRYEPPVQSSTGQFIDAAFVLIAVFAALWVPLALGLTGGATVRELPAGVTVTEAEDGSLAWHGLTWEALGQNETMQAQWTGLGMSIEDAADMITTRFDYSIDPLALLITAIVIVGYFFFMIRHSEREYRQVIAEKFGGRH